MKIMMQSELPFSDSLHMAGTVREVAPMYHLIELNNPQKRYYYLLGFHKTETQNS
jgi:hypothetical protein